MITNVYAEQDAGQVFINYVLTHPENKHCLVSVEISNDGGVTYTIEPTTLSGDVGIVAGTAQGSSYQIVWNYGADGVGTGENYRAKVIANDNIPTIVDDDVAVIDNEDTDLILGISENELIVSNAVNPDLIQVGKIIIKEPCPEFPDGIMRKVTGYSVQGNQIVLTTVQATLEDAFEQLYISFAEPLKASDVSSIYPLVDGITIDMDTRNPIGLNFDLNWTKIVTNPDGFSVVVNLDGSLNFNLGYVFDVGVNPFNGLRYVKCGGYGSSSVSLELEVTGGVHYNEEVELGVIDFNPIVFWIGPVPVWITPRIVIKGEFDTYTGAQLIAAADASVSLSAGLVFNKPNWNVYCNFDASFGYQPPILNSGLNAELMVGPNLELNLYSIAGPEIFVGGFLELEANASLTPWWTLRGGVKGEAGVKFEALGYEEEYTATLFDYSQILLQADTAVGDLVGQVRNALNNQGLPGVSVIVYNSTNDEIVSGVTNAQGYYNLELLANSGYNVVFSKPGFHTVTYHNVTINANASTDLQTVMQIDDMYDGVGTISGYLYNALNGAPVATVALVFRPGLNNNSGNPAGSTVTGANGYYSISTLDTGNYTVEASKAGYITTYFSVIVVGGQTVNNQNGVITPDLEDSEVRIILTWGATPSDLDSHITGSNLAGGRFHVYYSNRNFYYNNELYCNLDVDDVTSYGPETVTIYHQTSGLYRYSVHDYTNRNSTSSYAMSNSGATVRVYFGSDLIQTFYVPSNTIGTLWISFEMVNGQIYPVNAMSNVSNPGSVTKGDDDSELLIDLPEK